ncbi:MAG: TlpA family protein disulfide reductase [Bacteroidia bacterium]
MENAFNFNSVDFAKEFELLKDKIEEQNISSCSANYFYINIWSLACKPCVDEMQFIKKMVDDFNKKIFNVLVTIHSNEAVYSFMRNKEITMENFFLINEMMNFVSGIFNEIEEKKFKVPLHIVLNRKGEVLAYLFGAFHDETSAAPLVNFINSLE